MRRLAILVAALLLAAAPAAAEKLTIALSTSDIRIDSNFSGTAVTVFGVIERDAATVSRAAGYEVAVTLRGPPEAVVARRKDRFLGIWANRASATITGAPAFYGVATTRDLADIAAATLLKRLEVGFDNVGLAFPGSPPAGDPSVTEFRKAFIRLMQEGGLYVDQPTGVTFIGDSVFRATIPLPANLPHGSYDLDVYLFSGGSLAAEASDHITVTKTGVEQVMYAAATNHALAYGLACVILALFTGWLAGVIFRRD